MPRILTTVALAFALLLPLGAGLAPSVVAEERAAPAGGVLSLLPEPVTSEHRITVGGRTLAYRATAGTLPLLAGNGAVAAEVFHVAYDLVAEPAGGEGSADPGKAPAERPITFVFNGGPGASAVYLHLGALGPRVLVTAEDGGFLPPPQRLADNPDTWLPMTDLVFVDPVGTGYSRAAPGTEEKSFWGVKQDAEALGAFIRLYLAKTGRTGAPVYLAGESYGGFRVALLARTLQEEIGITPRGVALISPALEFALIRPDSFDLLHWALELPSLAAARLQSEGVTGEALKQRLAEVERYALTDYLIALASGLEEGGRAASAKVAEITGLPVALVERHFARIPTGVFVREFRRDTGKVLSLYDATIAAADPGRGRGRRGPDPVLGRSIPVLNSAFVTYVREELGYRTDVSYRVLNRQVSRHWDYGIGPSQGYAGVMDDLQQARALNPDLGVLLVSGTADLVTPYMTARYLTEQVASLANARPMRVEVLEGGHMMYFRPDSRAALTSAASGLYETAD